MSLLKNFKFGVYRMSRINSCSTCSSCSMQSLICVKCCGCVDLKIGCFIIGYINLVILLLEAVLAVSNDLRPITKNDFLEFVVEHIESITVLVALAFGIALLVGLHKNDPGLLKGYLIYSVVFTVLSLVQVIVDASFLHLVNTVFGTYFLFVVRSMYHQMKDVPILANCPVQDLETGIKPNTSTT